jgi:hypothetical protein
MARACGNGIPIRNPAGISVNQEIKTLTDILNPAYSAKTIGIKTVCTTIKTGSARRIRGIIFMPLR